MSAGQPMLWNDARVGDQGDRTWTNIPEDAIAALHRRHYGGLVNRAIPLVGSVHDAHLVATEAFEDALHEYVEGKGMRFATFLHDYIFKRALSTVRHANAMTPIGPDPEDPDPQEIKPGPEDLGVQGDQNRRLLDQLHRRIDDSRRKLKMRVVMHGIVDRWAEIGLGHRALSRGMKQQWATQLGCSTFDVSRACGFLREVAEGFLAEGEDGGS